MIYAAELDRLAQAHSGLDVQLTFTRQAPPGWKGYARRIDQAMLAEVLASTGPKVYAYVCGPTLLVESVANLLLEAGLAREAIRTERFGPSGGVTELSPDAGQAK